MLTKILNALYLTPPCVKNNSLNSSHVGYYTKKFYFIYKTGRGLRQKNEQYITSNGNNSK